MIHFRNKICFMLGALLASCLTNSDLHAQLDRVYPLKGSTVQGVVKTITKDVIKIQVGGDMKDLPINTIRRIIFEGDPGSVGKGRDQILDGQYDTGLVEIEKTDINKVARDEIKAEFMFYRAFAMGKLALSGRRDPADAAKAMLEFAGKYRESWHYYEAAQMLGDLAMQLGSADKAAQYYAALASAPFPEFQLQARYLEGLALLKSGKAADALARFESVIGASTTSPEAVRFQKMATAGKVAALGESGEIDKAIEALKTLIRENDPSDIEISSRVYNSQGSVLLKKLDFEGALLAYLHTDLLFSAAADAHTEALKQLIELWNKLGQPDRAAATRTKLKRLYPGAKV